MERWLSKPRVVFALCAVLLVGAFNRADPMVYGLFLFLALIGGLGYSLPWLSLRSAVLQRVQKLPAELSTREGQPVDLSLTLRQGGWWPACVVEVEAHWEWASHHFVSRSTVPLLRPRQLVRVLDAVEFKCRGRYRLQKIRMRSGFPLGLVHSERSMEVDQCVALVRPQPGDLALPGDWTVSADPSGDATTRHLGDSMELSLLREYKPGEPLGRVDWRASSRVGDLIIRHYHEAASIFLRVVVHVPDQKEVARNGSPGEEAVRVGAAVMTQLARQRLRFALYVSGEPAPEVSLQEAMHALAAARPNGPATRDVIAWAVRDLKRGEQLMAVMPVTADGGLLVRTAADASVAGARLVVVIANAQGMSGALQSQAQSLRVVLLQAGIDVRLAWP